MDLTFYLAGSAHTSLIAELGLRVVKSVLTLFAPQLVAGCWQLGWFAALLEGSFPGNKNCEGRKFSRSPYLHIQVEMKA